MKFNASNVARAAVVASIFFAAIVALAQSGQKARSETNARDAQTSNASAGEERGLFVVASSRRWAVLVGVNDYDAFKDLRYAVADTTNLRDKLIDVGFSRERVHCLVSGATETSDLPIKNNIENRIQTVAENAGEDDLIVVSLSGHGLDFGDSDDPKSREAYFVPADANNASELKLRDSLVKIDWIYETLSKSKAKFKLVLVDACRDNPFKGANRATSEDGFRATQGFSNPPAGIMLLQSCSASQVSWESSELGQGVFSRAFLEGLGGKAANKDGKITLLGLVDYTTTRTESYVAEHFRKSQRPLVVGSTGNFVVFDATGLTFEQRKKADAFFESARANRKAGKLDDANSEISAALDIWNDNEDYREEAATILQLMAASTSENGEGAILKPRPVPTTSDKLQYAIEQVDISRNRYKAYRKTLASLEEDYYDDDPQIVQCKQETFREGVLFAGYMRDVRLRYDAEIASLETKIKNLIEVQRMRPNAKTVRSYQDKIAKLKKEKENYPQVASPETFEEVDMVFAGVTQEVIDARRRRLSEATSWDDGDEGKRAGERRFIEIAGKRCALVWCPPGKFTMGSPSDEEGRSRDESQREVNIDEGFWIFETETTQGLWNAVGVEKNKKCCYRGNNLPVENVTWRECDAFIKKLNDLGVAPNGWRFALPTEEQWEYACRAGTTGSTYGVPLDDAAWYYNNGGMRTHEVGTKKPNNWGIYDMLGNVWEWTSSKYKVGSSFVNRGGCWINDAQRCRPAKRYFSDPTDCDGGLGFRAVLVRSESR